METRGKLNLTTQYVLIFGAILLAANILLGIVLVNQTRAALRSMLEKNMLDITNTAAGMVDGDRLGAMTGADVGGDFCNDVVRTLRVFRERVEIEFIYVVRQAGPERFVFVIDPDPVDPAAYGEEIVFTYALGEAGRGVATVDSAPQEDRWGNFYSAYSPVLDSGGAVAGIIGVDFDAEWYNQQLRQVTLTVALISTLTVLAGIAVTVLITARTRKRFSKLSDELSGLSADVDELTGILTAAPVQAAAGTQPAAAAPAGQPASRSVDEIGALSEKVHSMEDAMRRYLDYVHAQVNTDALTGVGNTTAYLERVRELDERADGSGVNYAIAVFDVDRLKEINDLLGHACGDTVIRAASAVISGVFGKENVYRIGGDEFLAITDDTSFAVMEKKLANVNADAKTYHMPDARCAGRLSISGGAAVHRADSPENFQAVFIRADDAMYVRKSERHSAYGVQ